MAGDMVPGATETLTIVVRFEQLGTIVNVASVTSDIIDSDPTNTVSAATVVVESGLPVTGADTDRLGLFGLMMLLLGLVVVFGSRRRVRR